jgi:hypothetical protein
MWTKHSAPVTLSQERRKADAAETLAMRKWAAKKQQQDNVTRIERLIEALHRTATALERFGPDV